MARHAPKNDAPVCGICGRKGKLTRTECCGNWICDDEEKYVPFTFARNSCSRNHRRYTLCGHHYIEEHPGHWKDCPECRKEFVAEMYVWYGTNEYNFEKLDNPPSYEPTRCAICGKVIKLGTDEYSQLGDEYRCGHCTNRRPVTRFVRDLDGPPAEEAVAQAKRAKVAQRPLPLRRRKKIQALLLWKARGRDISGREPGQ